MPPRALSCPLLFSHPPPCARLPRPPPQVHTSKKTTPPQALSSALSELTEEVSDLKRQFEAQVLVLVPPAAQQPQAMDVGFG